MNISEKLADSPLPFADSTEQDFGWDHVRSTVNMLKLAVAQIEVSMHDGNNSVNTLTHSFSQMAGNMHAVSVNASSLPEDETYSELRQEIIGRCSEVEGGMQSAIIAFQFYDKLVQRLSHVSESLDELGGMVIDPERIFSETEWQNLQEHIRSRYTMPQERVMFDALMHGSSVQEALLLGAEESSKGGADNDDDIELF